MQALIDKLKAGQRIIASEETLLAIEQYDGDYANNIASARNRNQLGTKDQYVAWDATIPGAAPADLEHRVGYAVGSK